MHTTHQNFTSNIHLHAIIRPHFYFRRWVFDVFLRGGTVMSNTTYCIFSDNCILREREIFTLTNVFNSLKNVKVQHQ